MRKWLFNVSIAKDEDALATYSFSDDATSVGLEYLTGVAPVPPNQLCEVLCTVAFLSTFVSVARDNHPL